LPSLTEAVKRLITQDRRRALDERGKRVADASAQALGQARAAATYAWDASPISTARLSAELWNVVKGKDWANAGGGVTRLWNVDKHYQTLAGGGVAGVGSALPTSIGAALAHRKHGRFVVSVQNDGDLMYAPGALWTAAHHRIPILFVMHNNRAYHQEVMHLQRMAAVHKRRPDTYAVGTTIDNPNVDFAKLAAAYGVWSEGPISDPAKLGPA